MMRTATIATFAYLACSIHVFGFMPNRDRGVDAGDDAVRLMYRLPQYHTIEYHCATVMTQRFHVLDQTAESVVALTADLRLNVVDRVMNASTVNVRVDSLRIATHVNGSADGPATDTMLRLSPKEQLQMVVEPHGATRMLDEKGMSSIPDEVLVLLDNSSILRQLFVRFPTKDMRRNEQWSELYVDTVTAPQGMGEITVEGMIQYTYRGVQDTLGRQCWVIEWEAPSLQQYGTFQRSGMSMVIRGDAFTTGRSLQCSSTGEIIRLASQTDSKLNMTLANAPERSFPVHSTLISTISQQPRRP